MGCEEPRLAGVWAEGGSWLCQEHHERLLSVRAIFDDVSPVARAFKEEVDISALHPDAEGFYRQHKHKTGKKKRGSTCCRIGCDNERVPPEAYCPICQAEGWAEE